MSVGIASTEIIGPEFTPQEPPEMPESNDPFTINEDGSIDVNISGTLNVSKSSIFESNVTINGDLVVQGVNILEELQNLRSLIPTT